MERGNELRLTNGRACLASEDVLQLKEPRESPTILSSQPLKMSMDNWAALYAALVHGLSYTLSPPGEIYTTTPRYLSCKSHEPALS
jgi:hypothetical protein